MITITVSCSKCNGDSGKPNLEFMTETLEEINPAALERAVKARGWIVEFNDGYIDTYCTKKCAE